MLRVILSFLAYGYFGNSFSSMTFSLYLFICVVKYAYTGR